MIEFGGYVSDSLVNPNLTFDQKFANTYYDAQSIFFKIKDYTGDAVKWNAAAQRAEAVYRDLYTVPNDGGVPGYWNFTHGLTESWQRDGDATSKNAVNLLATNGAYAVSSPSSDADLASAEGSRENAYILMAYLNNYRNGAPLNPRVNQLMENAFSHLDQWTASRTADYVRPFMIALTSQALIEYDAQVGGINARLRDALAAAWGWTWVNMWLPAQQTFQYTNIDTCSLPAGHPARCTGGTEPAVDLNLLIAPVFGWLYHQTGDQSWVTRGDQIFNGGVSVYDGPYQASGAYLGGRNVTGVSGKHFNLNYRWSFEYVRWRSMPAGPLTGLQYYPLANPIRLLDTRAGQPACDAPGAPLTGGTSRTQSALLTCGGATIPSNAKAIVGNATVVNNTAGAGTGYVTLYSSGTARPTVSNLNYVPGQVVPNSFTVTLGNDGAFQIYAHSDTNFIVDVTGYYAPPGAGGLYYHPLPSPIRLLDTRPGQSACDAPGQPLSGGGVRTQPARLTCGGATIPSGAKAVVGNATAVNDVPGGTSGFITLYPGGGTRPAASNLNFVPGQVVPNAFTVGLGADGAFQIYASSTTNFVVDVAGYFSDQAADENGQGLLYNAPAAPVRLLDTRPGALAYRAPGVPLAGGGVRTEVARGASAIPLGAQVIVGNATVVNNLAGATSGYVTLFPNGMTRPNASNLNYVTGQTVPNAFTVKLGTGGALAIYASSGTHFITDVAGYFAP